MLLNTPLCKFGWQATNFSLKDASGKTYSLQEQMGENGLLIAFICNHCPYVKAIADRLAEDAKTLKDIGINTLAIMSNDYTEYTEDSPENMILFAEKHNFDFPYLIDKEQKIGKEYGAVCTPDFFGFNKKGQLQYRGRLDDAGMNNPQNRTPELLNAMQLIAKTDQGPKVQLPSMGCSIKWKE